MELSTLPREFDTIDSFALLEAKNWQEKYKILMAWGNSLSVKPTLRRDEYLVRGCDTSLWLFSSLHQERLFFAVDGDSRIIKGLAALLLSKVDGVTKAELLSMDLQKLLQQFQLDSHLTPSRNNGFQALVSRVQQAARAD